MTPNLRTLAFGAVAGILAGAAGAQQVPEALQTPPNEQLVVQVHAKGQQIYSCKVMAKLLGNTSRGRHGKRATEAEWWEKLRRMRPRRMLTRFRGYS